MRLEDLQALARPSERKILLLVLDGLGGLPRRPGGPTELEAARTPHLDELLARGGCGLHDPVAPGVTPGSGPGHLALFGYDPLRYRTGRGVLEALGIEFPLEPTDVAARGNFATLDGEGRVADRRAGRIASADAEPLCRRLDAIEVDGAEVFVRHVKEHRFLLVLRFPERVPGALTDTDPGQPGLAPEPLEARDEASGKARDVARAWLEGAREELAGETPANGVLLRGFDARPDWPAFPDVFGVRALAAAAYPMYRGVARLVGMDAVAVDDGMDPLAGVLAERREEADFFFLHFKPTDRAGEDGDFDRKVALIEEADTALPRLVESGPDVVLVTGDHSTPSVHRSHSWHPVPFLLAEPNARAGGATEFGEAGCAGGGWGTRRGRELMPLAMAAAGRLERFGA